MAQRFNPPPNWPAPPEGWTPPAGWQPDPSWGPAPQGWQLWVDDDQSQPTAPLLPVPPAAPAAPAASAPARPGKKWPWVVGIAAALLVGVAIGSAGPGSTTTTTSAAADSEAQPTVTVTSTVSAPAAAPAATKTVTKTVTATPAAPAGGDGQGAAASPDGQATGRLPIQNGDWRLDSVSIKKGFGGDFDGRARVTYTGQDGNGGGNAFTITLFKGGRDVGSLTGFANDVLPGKTVTVQLISTDKFVAGPWTYDFQNNW